MKLDARWRLQPLSDVVDILDSQRVPVKASDRAKLGGSIPYYGATGQAGTINRAIFNEPLVLLGEDGAPFFDLAKPKAYLIDGPAWVNNHAHVLRTGQDLDRSFLKHYLDAFDYRGFANGTTRLKLTQGAMRRIPVPTPKLSEQRRIVEILEEHLSHLDAADAEVARCRVKLDALWAATLSRARTGSVTPLPEVADVQGGIQKQPRRAPMVNHHPFLRVANVTSSGLDLADVHRVELFGDELTRLRLEPGDLLVVEGNGSASQIGRAAMWDGSIEDCVHQNHLIRVRPKGSMLPGYLEAVWNSPEHRRKLMDVASSSSGLYTLSVSKLKQLTVPLPSFDEQRRVVDRVDQVRASIRRLEGMLVVAETRAESLRRAVLASAFEGKLTGRHTDNEVIEELADV